MSIDPGRLVAVLRAQQAVIGALADALEGAPAATESTAQAALPASAEPQKRGRGRPAKGEGAPAASPAPAPSPAAAEADPFGSAPAVSTVTVDDVRAALVALKDATNQATALKVLNDAGGVQALPALPADKYAAVIAACKAATPSAQPAAEADPFESGAPAAQENAPSLEDVKAACVEAQKRTAVDTVQKVVIKHGGKDPASGGVSIKALPVPSYAAVIAELKALPTTK